MKTEITDKIHHGINIRLIRRGKNVSQQQLAEQLGDSWNQQRISDLEAKEIIEDALLEEIAEALKVPVDTIKTLNPEGSTNYTINNFAGSNPHNNNLGAHYHQCTFSLLDKFLEVIEKNEKLYESLLKAEREKNSMLEKVLNGKKKK